MKMDDFEKKKNRKLGKDNTNNDGGDGGVMVYDQYNYLSWACSIINLSSLYGGRPSLRLFSSLR